MSTTDLIRTFLTDRLGVQPEQVTPEAVLAELMFEAEDRLGIEIPSDVQPPKTVADMQSMIDALSGLKTG